VEDNPNNQQVAQELLMAEGASVDLADNGERGVEAVFAAQPPFDAVLMDLQMPVMDGYTATARIRQHPGCAALPIIAMTANAMSSDREACLAAGMNDHVGKPFELSDLVSAIRRHTGREDEAAAPPSPSVQFSPEQLQGAAAADIELAAAVQRLGGNAAVYGRMLRTFLHDLPGQMQRLQEHAQQSQWREAAVAAHTLKGLAGMIGAVQLQAAAGQAERLLEKTPEQAAPALQALDEAAQQVLREPQWAAQLGTSAAASAAGLDEAAARERFDQLLVLLQASDMRAVDLFEQLRQQPWMRSRSGCDELEAAIDSLDFDTAHRIGRRIGAQAVS